MSPEDDVQTVALPRILDAAALGPLRDTLCVALARGPVLLDGGAVERISANGFHLLLSAARSAAARDVTLTLARASPALSAAAQHLGMAPALVALSR